MYEKVLEKIREFHENEDGDITQTSIIIGILAIIAVGALMFLGPKVKAMFDRTGESLDKGIEYEY